MIRVLIYILLFYVGYRIIKTIASPKPAESSLKKPHTQASATYRDPVCGVFVSEEDAVVGRLNGERHYFCSRECLDKFSERINHTTSLP